MWFSDAMFDDKFQFYIGYKIPRFKKLEEIRAFIANLPTIDSPQAFGLHPNADITSVSFYKVSTLFFYRAMLYAKSGTSRRPVSVCPSVCHTLLCYIKTAKMSSDFVPAW